MSKFKEYVGFVMRPKTIAILSCLFMLWSSIATAKTVEITLVDKLDGKLSSYCLDIVGFNTKADPKEGLQSHTCYSYRGTLGVDQSFDEARLTKNQFYIPSFDVCVELTGTTAGSRVLLAKCNQSALQNIKLRKDGTIGPTSVPELCFTVAEKTILGRNPIHQKRTLTLEHCSYEARSRQRWRTRSSQDE